MDVVEVIVNLVEDTTRVVTDFPIGEIRTLRNFCEKVALVSDDYNECKLACELEMELGKLERAANKRYGECAASEAREKEGNTDHRPVLRLSGSFASLLSRARQRAREYGLGEDVIAKMTSDAKADNYSKLRNVLNIYFEVC